MPETENFVRKCGKHGGKGEKTPKFSVSLSTFVWKRGLRFVYGKK